MILACPDGLLVDGYIQCCNWFYGIDALFYLCLFFVSRSKLYWYTLTSVQKLCRTGEGGKFGKTIPG